MRHHHDDDEDHDQVVDGGHVTVPMFAMDAVQRAVAQNAAHLHDGHGNAPGHRPGFIVDANDARAAVDRAYALRDEADRNAWRTNGVEDSEGSTCTVRDGLTLDQLEREHQGRMAREYQAYDNRIKQQWCNP